jgi:pyoverdine/dityrosine biosynthesis protein Dit1
MTTVQTANPTVTFLPIAPATETAQAILMEVMRHRRMAGAESCTCDACLAPHLPRIAAKVALNQPVTFVLPAFPGKSPNQAKVLGTLPDMAEENALKFLQQLAERIGEIYAPGAQIVLASDGRIFSDVVGLRDEDVTAYRDSLNGMIASLGLKNLSTFNLEELYTDATFDEMRANVMAEFSQSTDDLRAAVKNAQTPEEVELNRLYCGITRFLVEDATFPGQAMSRNQIQKDARARAYGVIQRSNAWSGVVEKHFPEAVRLSIHPHGCGSAKLGIHLSEPAQADNWITPWHGVALELEDGRFVLAKRSQAEALGAKIVTVNGRPSHFTLG